MTELSLHLPTLPHPTPLGYQDGQQHFHSHSIAYCCISLASYLCDIGQGPTPLCLR